MPFQTQYGKKRASIWMTTLPARFVRVPPGWSAKLFDRELAGWNWVKRPVKGSQRMWGAEGIPSGLRPNQLTRRS